jgi:hypothetical protein
VCGATPRLEAMRRCEAQAQEGEHRHRVFVLVEVRKTENTQPPRTENARGGARQYIYAATALY